MKHKTKTTLFNFENIYKAYQSCIKNKRATYNALVYEQNLLENLWALCEVLNSRNYHIGSSLCFLTSSPKLREIFAADFKDRVVHHLLINAIEGFYEKKFIYDVYNNRKKKGTHKAIQRAQYFMRKESVNYYLQLDIKGFFYNIDKNILYKKVANDISKSDLEFQDEILYLAHKIIYHDSTKNYRFRGNIEKLKQLPEHKTLFKIPKHKGLPIGNLSSQFFANVYMNDFDNFIKRELKVKYYIRYVDDFVLFDTSKERLQTLKHKIEVYLYENLSLTLRDDFKLKNINQGLDFLGYVVREHYTLVRKRVIKNYKFKKAKYLERYEKEEGKMDFELIKAFLAVQSSFTGHCKHANSYKLLKTQKIKDDQNEEKYCKNITTVWNTK